LSKSRDATTGPVFPDRAAALLHVKQSPEKRFTLLKVNNDAITAVCTNPLGYAVETPPPVGPSTRLSTKDILFTGAVTAGKSKKTCSEVSAFKVCQQY